jgi:hypothetical protein
MTLHIEATMGNLIALRTMGYDFTLKSTEYLRLNLDMSDRVLQIYLSGRVGIRIISEMHPSVIRTLITLEQAAEIRTLLSLGMSTESAYALFS